MTFRSIFGFFWRMVKGILRATWRLLVDIWKHNVSRPVRNFIVKKFWWVAIFMFLVVLSLFPSGTQNAVLSSLAGPAFVIIAILVGFGMLTGKPTLFLPIGKKKKK